MRIPNQHPLIYLDQAAEALVSAGFSVDEVENGMLWLAENGALIADMLPNEHWRHPHDFIEGKRPPIIRISTSQMYVVVSDGNALRSGWVFFRAPANSLQAIAQYLRGGANLQPAAAGLAAIAAARSSAAIAVKNTEGASNDASPQPRPGMQSVPEKKAEGACGAWLAELATDGDFRPAGNDAAGPKEALFLRAAQMFPGLSRAAFDRQWGIHAPSSWKKTGPRSPALPMTD